MATQPTNELASPQDQAAQQDKKLQKLPQYQNPAANLAQNPMYSVPTDPNVPWLTGNTQEQIAQLAGLTNAQIGYGQSLQQTGQNISDIRDKLKERANQGASDPITAAIMAQKADAVANAQRNMQASGVKGGAAAGAADAIGRQRDAEIAASLYGQQRQSINDLRSLESNTLSGTMGLMQGNKGEAIANQMPSAPKQNSLMDSVICTEVWRQGYMSKWLLDLDTAYGISLRKKDPYIIIGYHFWAKPTVKYMKKSKTLSFLLRFPALKWARHIAGVESSLTGYVLQKVGEPVCSIIGRIVTAFSGEKYETNLSNH